MRLFLSLVFTATFSFSPILKGQTISSFPYSESFEAGQGNWTNATPTTSHWSRRSGSTPSSNTGPSAASHGTYYMYAEATGNYGDVTILEGPSFDLTQESVASFGFDFHMHGASMGSLKAEISSNGGTSWTQVWEKSGAQDNIWQTDAIDISSYTGQVVVIRFTATIGASFTSDMAIDNLKLVTNSVILRWS